MLISQDGVSLTDELVRSMSIHRRFESLFRCFRQEKRVLVVIGLASIVILLLFARQEEEKVELPLKSVATTYEKPTSIPTTTSHAAVANTFNLSNVLENTIKQLETDGWIAPAGSEGVLQRLRKMNPGLRVTTAPTLDYVKPTGPVLVTADRWKVNYVGCFYESPLSRPLTPVRPKDQVVSVTACLRKCDDEGQAFAAISAGSLCTCGRSIPKSSIFLLSWADRLCNMTCQYGADNRTCGGFKYASVYKISVHARENLTIHDVNQRSSGCFVKPVDFEKVFTKKVIIYNGSAAHCLIHCERTFQVVAAWDPQIGECMCGKYDIRLPRETLKKSPVESFCNGRYCKRVKYCKTRYMTSMRTYAQDYRCETKKFLPGRTGTLSALASFPGSGNTWIRHLIESATGIYSGSIYNDEGLYEQGFLGELVPWNSRRTSIIKTHEYDNNGSSLFEAVVILIRNPYDGIMAEYNRLVGGHTGYAEPEHFRVKEWKYFVIYKLNKWLKIIKQYSALDKVHVVFFEDVLMNPIGELRAIIRFLGIRVANFEDRLHCLKSGIEGDFKRAKRKLDFDPFTDVLKENVNLAIQQGREILQKKSHPTMPYYERA